MLYHRLGLAHRSRPARWWRALIELVVLAALVAALTIGIIVVIGFMAGRSGRDFAQLIEGSVDPLTPLVQVLIIAAMLPAPFLAARISGRDPRALHSTALRLRWSVLSRALLVVGAVYGATVLFDILRGLPEDTTVTPFRMKIVVALIVAVPLQSAAEEFVFRGALPQILGQWRAPAWLAYALPGVLFIAGHAYNWVGLIDIAIFAVCTAVLTWRTGGLEASIALHAISNTVFFVFGAVGVTDPNATDIGVQQMLSASLFTVACTALLLWVLRGVTAQSSPAGEEVSNQRQEQLVTVDTTA